MHVELNKSSFRQRLKRIYDSWNEASTNDDYSSIADVDALFLLAGDPVPEDQPVQKGTTFQQWLLGYEFPSTMILFQKDKVSILCSSVKAKILSQIEGTKGIVPVQIFAQPKSKEPPNDSLANFFQLYSSSQKLATLTKEQHTGKLLNEWKKVADAAERKPTEVDISAAMSAFMALKDEDELKATQTAAILTSTLLKHHVAPKLETILDRETKITHEMLSATIEARMGSGEGENAKGPDMKVWKNSKELNDIDWGVVEFSYSPIIISSSSKKGYDLRYTAESSDDNISHQGVLLVAFGMRYKTYCTNLARTFIVDPTQEQQAQYEFLLKLQSELVGYIKDGVVARDVYQHALEFIQANKPELEKHFTKSIGWATGIEFRDSVYLLSAKNTKTLKETMVFNLVLGFTDLVNEKGKKYALQLADTIQVESKRSTLLTDGIKVTKDTLFFLTQGSDEERPKKSERKPPAQSRANGSPAKTKTVGGKVLRNGSRRAVQDEVHKTAAAKQIEHQRELHEKLQKEGLSKYSEEGGGAGGKEGKTWKKFQSYKGEGALPTEVDKLRIHVDRKAQTVILPINGFAVPFHIHTIKNASKSEEGNYIYLRINFQTPGQLTGKKEDTPFEDPDATFIRSVSYRSSDGHRFDGIYKQITDLKRDINKREQQKKEMADVIEQDNLVELKGRRPARISEAFIRPPTDGKRLPGDVEIHQNGLRFVSPLGHKVDVLFSNIRHLFFQPCDHELQVIVHVHLKAPIIIGKKKTTDVQFYREATDAQFDETGNRKRKHRYGDEDEIELEQQERKRRQMLNREMKAFSEKIAEAASVSNGETLELDIPFRELSFEGVPYRTSVRMQPTTDCLVHLTDMPFLVITLGDIELASLERVQYGLKHFDLCLIFKDFTKPPLHINSIASNQMEDVKNWLDSVDIATTESPVNLNWAPIMKHINESPYEFFQGGGWSFLGASNGAESELSEDSASESDFEAEADDFADEESTDDASDFSDASGSSGSDFGGGDSDEDSGDDWDELERKAAKSDLKRAENGKPDDSDDDKRKKKSAKPSKPSKTNGAPKKRR